MKTLVVRLDHLGDLLLTTPLVRALSVGGHSVHVLVQDSLKPIFVGSLFVQGCFGIEEVAPRFPKAWWQLSSWMRRGEYDCVILAYGKQARLCLASGFSGAKRRIAMWSGVWGRLTGHECLASHILEQPRPVSEILLACSRAMGAPDQGLKPDLFLSSDELRFARDFIPEPLRNRRIVGIHPGSAGNACNLPSEVYGDLAALVLRETDCGLIVTGTRREEKLLGPWPKQILNSERVWVSLGQLDVRQLAAIVKTMTVYVCSSTGPLHLASAVGTATVSPFCPAPPLNATIWGNMGAASRVIEPKHCPRLSGESQCCNFLGQISADQLLSEIKILLAADT